MSMLSIAYGRSLSVAIDVWLEVFLCFGAVWGAIQFTVALANGKIKYAFYWLTATLVYLLIINALGITRWLV